MAPRHLPIVSRLSVRFDAIIAGAGPAGSAAAIRLAQAGWKTALVEKARFPRQKVCGEYISGATLPLLGGLGIADEYRAGAGPEIRRVALFARNRAITAAMPRAANPPGWGRALGRDRLDTLLAEAAVRAGATMFQPWTVKSAGRKSDVHVCTVVNGSEQIELQAPVFLAATGSWERAPWQAERRTARPADLFAFKARFSRSRLTSDVMSLLAFPGGYGGMAGTDLGLVSLSCCIRRDTLIAVRAQYPAPHAGDSVLHHIMASCEPVRDALTEAGMQGPWHAAGPIRPGIRVSARDGLFRLGNSAGEAHPVIAEGIAMALQSAHLLANLLIAQQGRLGDPKARRETLVEWRSLWRREFARRIRVSAAIASLAMSPHASALLPVIAQCPQMLSFGAKLSGKTCAIA